MIHGCGGVFMLVEDALVDAIVTLAAAMAYGALAFDHFCGQHHRARPARPASGEPPAPAGAVLSHKA